MRATKSITFIVALFLTALGIADAQLRYSSRNWFGLTLRNIPFDTMSEDCLPDDNPCERLTDCCSNFCRPGYPISLCEQSPCGCPQPPFTSEPIAEVCLRYGETCSGVPHHKCCTGYCQPMYPYKRCGEPPCVECH